MRILILLLFLFSSATFLYGQRHLEGLWEGTITFGGLHSQKEHKFELLIQLDGSKLKGRSYVHLQDGNIMT